MTDPLTLYEKRRKIIAELREINRQINEMELSESKRLGYLAKLNEVQLTRELMMEKAA